MPKTALFLFSLTIILGLCLGAVIDLDLPIFLVFLILIFFFFLLLSFKFRYIIILIVIFVFSFIYWPSLNTIPTDLSLGHHEFEAWVCKRPNSNWQRQIVVLCPLNENEKGKIISWWPLFPPLNYGDYLIVNCQLSLPEKIEEFNYPQYLARQGIYRQCSWPSLIYYKSGLKGNTFKKWTLNFRKKISLLITKNLGEPQAGLVLAMILGDRHSLIPRVAENFQKAGLSHLTAVSGAHISLLSLLFLFLWLSFGASKKTAWLPLFLFISFYVFLIGTRPSALRALIMSSLSLLAWRLERLPHPLSILSLTAALTLIINPWLLLDIAWQLSFFALLGITLLFSNLNNLIYYFTYKLPKIIRQILRPIFIAISLSLSVQILIWPLLAWHFQSLSLATVFTNVLAMFAFSALMFLLIPSLFLTYLFPFLANLLFTPIYYLATYLIYLANWSANWPGFYRSIEYFSWPYLTTYYLTIFSLIIVIRKLKK